MKTPDSLNVFDNGHCVLSPSGWSMWSKCSGSMLGLNDARKTSGDNQASIEGTTAHYLLEVALQRWISPMDVDCDDVDRHVVDDALSWWTKIKLNPNNTQEVKDYATKCREWIESGTFPHDMRVEVEKCYLRLLAYKNDGWTVYPEQKVSLKAFFGHEHCDGTSDVVMHKGNKFKIADLKYGKGIEVSPVNSGQLRLYGLGGIIRAVGASFAPDKPIPFTDIELVIMQPRINNGVWKTWRVEYDSGENSLLKFAQETKRKAASAISVLQGDTKNIIFAPSESSCAWCHRKRNCKARLDKATEDIRGLFAATGMIPGELNVSASEIDNKTLGEMLTQIPFIVSFANDMIVEAETRARKGQTIPGRKLVKGRASRKCSDEDGLMGALIRLGLNENDCNTTKIKSPAQFDKMKLTLLQKEAVKHYSNKSFGKPALVPNSDPRSALVVNPIQLFEVDQQTKHKGK